MVLTSFVRRRTLSTFDVTYFVCNLVLLIEAYVRPEEDDVADYLRRENGKLRRKGCDERVGVLLLVSLEAARRVVDLLEVRVVKWRLQVAHIGAGA